MIVKIIKGRIVHFEMRKKKNSMHRTLTLLVLEQRVHFVDGILTPGYQWCGG